MMGVVFAHNAPQTLSRLNIEELFWVVLLKSGRRFALFRKAKKVNLSIKNIMVTVFWKQAVKSTTINFDREEQLMANIVPTCLTGSTTI